MPTDQNNPWPPLAEPRFTGDEVHTIDTPEQVQLDLPIAGIGSRALALVIDVALQSLAYLVLALLVFFFGRNTGSRYLRIEGTWAVAIGLVTWFLITYGYFAFFEAIWNGQTPGKRILGIRVIKETGRPLTIVETITRNLMRLVDQLPFAYGVGFIVMLTNSRSQRLGDLVTGAFVVRDHAQPGAALFAPAVSSQQQQPAPGAPVTAMPAVHLTREDLMLVETFLNRRSDLAPDVRHHMARNILERIAQHAPLSVDPHKSPEQILEILAAHARGSFV